MPTPEAYQALALALALGLLVGLQRQHDDSQIAGIRTFPLIVLLGALSTLVGGTSSLWMVIAGMVCLTALLVIGNVIKMAAGEHEPGITTETAALLMYMVGAGVGLGMRGPAIVTTGLVAVLLHFKDSLHARIARIAARDLRGLVQWVLIALVILPVLPDRAYGPYHVLNPFQIWRMVALMVGISLGAYALQKFLGARVGAVLSGILGGMISSTATTLSYARKSHFSPAASSLAALVILLASAVVNLRILAEVAVVSPHLLSVLALPLGIVFLAMGLSCLALLFSQRAKTLELPHQENPAELKPAILLGLLYALVLFVVAAAEHHFGDQALYGVAALSGLTDVDAITLSTARLFGDGKIAADTSWRIIVIAIMSNLCFKLGAAAMLGSRQLALHMLVLFGIALTVSALLLAFWPGIALPEAWFDFAGT